MYSYMASRVLAPVLDFFRGNRTMKCLRSLEQSQWWPKSDLVELQNRRLRQLVRHAYGNVPYYRRLFNDSGLKPDDIESADDLAKLPALTKQLIRSNFDNLLTPDFPAKDLVPNRTSGSTGEPLAFYSTRHDQCNWGFAAGQRAYRWAGNELGEKCLWVRWMRPYKSRVEHLRETAARFFQRVIILNACEMSAENLRLYTRKLESFQPAFIRGYPSAIYLLARFIEREGRPKLRPKAIITTSEQLYGYQKKLFSKVFGCQTYDNYTSWEMLVIATECPEHNGYHIAAENIIIEVVDDDGELLPAGNEGRILLTNLHNYAMPFIRYDIGDLGVLSDETCPCGRGLPLLASLNGRQCDILYTASGRVISGLAIPQEFLVPFGVEQFQIVQDSLENIVVRLVINKKYPPSHLEQLTVEVRKQYQPIFGKDVLISTQFVKRIPHTEEGKRRVVISNLPQNNGLTA